MEGRLILKGGQALVSKGIKKKKKKKKIKHSDSEKPEETDVAQDPKGENPGKGNNTEEVTQLPAGTKPPSEYEAEFKLEMARAEEAKSRSTAWGVSYRAPPKVLHGYQAPVTGATFEQRLDTRCARKADRMCK